MEYGQREIASKLSEFAKEIGIDLFGICAAEKSLQNQSDLNQFLDKKYHGEMKYLENWEVRTDPQKLLPGAKSILIIGINYYRPQEEVSPGYGKIARYAHGRDYHRVLKKLLKKISSRLLELAPRAQLKLCVDSAPLSEKHFASRAGLGFIGKNTLLINQKFGSWILLGEIITDLELPVSKEEKGTCGNCTRCIDACPTGAILKPGKMLDATKCISYLTIENKHEIPTEFKGKMANYLFGCDICQEVCPYNKSFQKPLQLEEFKNVTIAGESLSFSEISAIKEDYQYLQKFAGSPLMRPKLKGLKRNADFLTWS